MRLILASHNRGKLRELRALLGSLPLELLSARDALGAPLDVVEHGETFEDNASLKARAVHEATCEWALADDSGLVVDALEGRPGVRSARYAGPDADDATNNAKLLGELDGIANRVARFVCVLALVGPGGEVRLVRGVCEGRIAHSPRGHHGFGYDPLFLPDATPGRSMAELLPDEKNRISHRAQANAALVPILEGLAKSSS